MSGVSAAVLALLLEGGTSPLLPPALALTSPYDGSSTLDPLTQSQAAKIRLCSANGGPPSVDVYFAAVHDNATMTPQLRSTDFGPTADEGILFTRVWMRDVSLDTHVESTRPLNPGEREDVSLSTDDITHAPSLPFTFTITW
jgi:hypothetical protein